MFRSAQQIGPRLFLSSLSSKPYLFALFSLTRLQCSSTKPDTSSKKKIILEEKDLTEQFVKGSGNGGQKVNKSSNCVILTHLPTKIQVRSHDTRSLHQNRNIARKRLIEKLDVLWNGEQSKIQQKIQTLRKKKLKKTQKSKKKYGATNASSEEQATAKEVQVDSASTTENKNQNLSSSETGENVLECKFEIGK